MVCVGIADATKSINAPFLACESVSSFKEFKKQNKKNLEENLNSVAREESNVVNNEEHSHAH